MNVMETRKFKVKNVMIMERDFEILEMLFKYRYLLAEQLANVYGVHIQVMRRRLNKLYNIKLIHKEQLRGYRVGQSRQGVVYSIATNGLNLLKENPESIKKYGEKLEMITPQHLRIQRWTQIPYVVTANDLGLELQKYDWEYYDSREAKRMYSFNRTNLVQAVFKDVEGRDLFYYCYMSSIKQKTFITLAKELVSNPLMQNVLITTKGEEATLKIHEFANAITYDKSTIHVTSNVLSLRVMDYDFAKLYFTCFTDDESVIEFVATAYPKWIQFKAEWETSKKLPFLNTVADMHRYNENSELVNTRETYVVNMLDVDLVKIKAVQQYNRYQYERDKRTVLLLITEAQKKYIEPYFTGDAYAHVLYFVIPEQHIERYRDEFYKLN